MKKQLVKEKTLNISFSTDFKESKCRRDEVQKEDGSLQGKKVVKSSKDNKFQFYDGNVNQGEKMFLNIPSEKVVNQPKNDACEGTGEESEMHGYLKSGRKMRNFNMVKSWRKTRNEECIDSMLIPRHFSNEESKQESNKKREANFYFPGQKSLLPARYRMGWRDEGNEIQTDILMIKSNRNIDDESEMYGNIICNEWGKNENTVQGKKTGLKKKLKEEKKIRKKIEAASKAEKKRLGKEEKEQKKIKEWLKKMNEKRAAERKGEITQNKRKRSKNVTNVCNNWKGCFKGNEEDEFVEQINNNYVQGSKSPCSNLNKEKVLEAGYEYHEILSDDREMLEKNQKVHKKMQQKAGKRRKEELKHEEKRLKKEEKEEKKIREWLGKLYAKRLADKDDKIRKKDDGLTCIINDSKFQNKKEKHPNNTKMVAGNRLTVGDSQGSDQDSCMAANSNSTLLFKSFGYDTVETYFGRDYDDWHGNIIPGKASKENLTARNQEEEVLAMEIETERSQNKSGDAFLELKANILSQKFKLNACKTIDDKISSLENLNKEKDAKVKFYKDRIKNKLAETQDQLKVSNCRVNLHEKKLERDEFEATNDEAEIQQLESSRKDRRKVMNLEDVGRLQTENDAELELGEEMPHKSTQISENEKRIAANHQQLVNEIKYQSGGFKLRENALQTLVSREQYETIIRSHEKEIQLYRRENDELKLLGSFGELDKLKGENSELKVSEKVLEKRIKGLGVNGKIQEMDDLRIKLEDRHNRIKLLENEKGNVEILLKNSELKKEKYIEEKENLMETNLKLKKENKILRTKLKLKYGKIEKCNQYLKIGNHQEVALFNEKTPKSGAFVKSLKNENRELLICLRNSEECLKNVMARDGEDSMKLRKANKHLKEENQILSRDKRILQSELSRAESKLVSTTKTLEYLQNDRDERVEPPEKNDVTNKLDIDHNAHVEYEAETWLEVILQHADKHEEPIHHRRKEEDLEKPGKNNLVCERRVLQRR